MFYEHKNIDKESARENAMLVVQAKLSAYPKKTADVTLKVYVPDGTARPTKETLAEHLKEREKCEPNVKVLKIKHGFLGIPRGIWIEEINPNKNLEGILSDNISLMQPAESACSYLKRILKHSAKYAFASSRLSYSDFLIPFKEIGENHLIHQYVLNYGSVYLRFTTERGSIEIKRKRNKRRIVSKRYEWYSEELAPLYSLWNTEEVRHTSEEWGEMSIPHFNAVVPLVYTGFMYSRPSSNETERKSDFAWFFHHRGAKIKSIEIIKGNKSENKVLFNNVPTCIELDDNESIDNGLYSAEESIKYSRIKYGMID